MPARVGIVGSREYPRPDLVEAFVGRLKPDTVVVSGRGRGVDRWAEAAALRRGLGTLIFPADWERDGKKAGFKRNRLIVEHSDYVVGFWDGRSRGTRHSLTLASAGRQMKLFRVYDAEGTHLDGPAWGARYVAGKAR